MRKSRCWLGLFAVTGFAAAHALDFTFVYGDGAESERHLLATGHGYWPVAVAVASLAAAVAVVVAIGRGARRGLRAGTDIEGAASGCKGRGLAAGIFGLAALQVGLFVVMEVLERLAAGVDPAALVRAPEFAAGLVIQVLVAAVAAVVLAVIEGVSERIVRAVRSRRPRTRPRVGSRQVAVLAVPFATTSFSPAGPRGPPVPVAH